MSIAALAPSPHPMLSPSPSGEEPLGKQLIEAVRSGRNLEQVRRLSLRISEIGRDDFKEALQATAQTGYRLALQALLRGGVEGVAAMDPADLKQTLLIAAENGRDTIVADLVDNGLFVQKVGIETAFGLPLCKAASRGYTTIVQLLLDRERVKQVSSPPFRIALFGAAKGGYAPIVATLLKACQPAPPSWVSASQPCRVKCPKPAEAAVKKGLPPPQSTIFQEHDLTRALDFAVLYDRISVVDILALAWPQRGTVSLLMEAVRREMGPYVRAFLKSPVFCSLMRNGEMVSIFKRAIEVENEEILLALALSTYCKERLSKRELQEIFCVTIEQKKRRVYELLSCEEGSPFSQVHFEISTDHLCWVLKALALSNGMDRLEEVLGQYGPIFDQLTQEQVESVMVYYLELNDPSSISLLYAKVKERLSSELDARVQNALRDETQGPG